MVLTVDAGNSNIVAGVYDEERLLTHWRISTVPYRTSDEMLVTLRAMFTEADIDPAAISLVGLSSVVPPVTEGLKAALARLCHCEPFIVTPASVPWLEIATENRNEMGPDLMANAVAGAAISEGYCAVIDFGTALTITSVDPDGKVLGVSIAPGLGTATEALSSGTAQLPEVALEAPPSPFGTNTVSAIQAGLVYGYAGMVDGMISRLEHHFESPVTALATGGLCRVVVPHVPKISHTDPWLTLQGLRMIVTR